ncbi:hypothetical protein M569_07182, partial [Genlisea aurea]
MTANEKATRLREDKERLEGEISDVVSFFQGLTRNDRVSAVDLYTVLPCFIDDSEESDCEMDLQELEATKEAYISA